MIIVKGIYTTKNPQVRMLRLESSSTTTTDNFGFFMVGLVGSVNSKRTTFFPVSVQFIEDKNITIDCDFEACIGRPCKIVIRESFEPSYVKSNGMPQEPKKIPGIQPDYYLKKDGKPIYRNTYLEIDSSKFEDVFIKHDPIPDEVKLKIKNLNAEHTTKVYNDLLGGNILAEPELD